MTPLIFFFSSRRRHTRFDCDWSSDVCSSDLDELGIARQLEGAAQVRLEIVQLPKPIHGAVAYSLDFCQGPAAPVRHAFGFAFQSRGNQCVSLLLIILGLASPAGLNLPERTDPGGAHALAPQGSGMAIDVIDGSNFQIQIGRASCRERV